MKTSALIKIIFVAIIIYGIYWVINPSEKDNALTKAPNENFQYYEVIKSPTPVVVIFTTEELWDRESNIFRISSPAPVILAIKDIMKEARYGDKVKFWRYIVPDGSYNPTTRFFDKDPVCKELNIQWVPTVIIFKNGSIVKKLEGGGCTLEESKEKIEQEISTILR